MSAKWIDTNTTNSFAAKTTTTGCEAENETIFMEKYAQNNSDSFENSSEPESN